VYSHTSHEACVIKRLVRPRLSPPMYNMVQSCNGRSLEDVPWLLIDNMPRSTTDGGSELRGILE
jgi:hypothetical protein